MHSWFSLHACHAGKTRLNPFQLFEIILFFSLSLSPNRSLISLCDSIYLCHDFNSATGLFGTKKKHTHSAFELFVKQIANLQITLNRHAIRMTFRLSTKFTTVLLKKISSIGLLRRKSMPFKIKLTHIQKKQNCTQKKTTINYTHHSIRNSFEQQQNSVELYGGFV